MAPWLGTQEGSGRGFLFLLAKMCQDPIDNVLVLNASDDFDGSTAATTNFNIDDAPSAEPVIYPARSPG